MFAKTRNMHISLYILIWINISLYSFKNLYQNAYLFFHWSEFQQYIDNGDFYVEFL